jgi:hypothetical protein
MPPGVKAQLVFLCKTESRSNSARFRCAFQEIKKWALFPVNSSELCPGEQDGQTFAPARRFPPCILTIHSLFAIVADLFKPMDPAGISLKPQKDFSGEKHLGKPNYAILEFNLNH